VGAAYPGGSYIWNQTPSSWNNEYEVRTTITLNGNGGTYQEYLLAQPNALSGVAGNTVLVELQNPAFTGNTCTATLAMYELINGGLTQLLGTSVSCTQTTVMRTVAIGSLVAVLVNGQYYSATTSLTGGAGGYGEHDAPANNYISSVSIGPFNLAAPNPISVESITT
jgi:hypothetical protein